MSLLNPLTVDHLSSEILKSEEIALSLLPTNEDGLPYPKHEKQIKEAYAIVLECLRLKAQGKDEGYVGALLALNEIFGFEVFSQKLGASRDLKGTMKAINAEYQVARELAASNKWTTRENIINNNGRTR